MGLCGKLAAGVIAALLLPVLARAQSQPPTESLHISTTGTASTWLDTGETNVIVIDGPVTIVADRVELSAASAVVWIRPSPGEVLDQSRAEIALVGAARMTQGQIEREGERLFVTMNVRGTIRITAAKRVTRNLSTSPLYENALLLRPEGATGLGTPGPTEVPQQRPWITTPPSPLPTTLPTDQRVRPPEPVSFRAGDVQTSTTADGNIALVLSRDVVLLQTRRDGDFVELQAERAVLFTPLKHLRELAEEGNFKQVEDAVTAAYLEGDVRISYTPSGVRQPEQRLRAQRVYYEFATDRAILTDAVLHTLEPNRQIPVVVRAETIRQLTLGEYNTERVELSTSAFAVPSYSVAADRAYVRSYDTNDPRYGQRTDFQAHNATFQLFDVPVFWLPAVGGSMTQRGFPLRQIEFADTNRTGPSILTNWGLFESLGLVPPKGLDVGYSLDYLCDRGFAFGFDGDYRGGFITETTKEPWSFDGDFDAWFLPSDHGEDKLGRDRATVEPEEDFRGQAIWQHQHFFPEGWQVQLRAGWASDPTFLEEFYESQFNNGLPRDLSAYIKRQRETEALTFSVNYQPLDFVTTADQLQENFEVEHLPEVGYRRIGDSLGDDRFTFFSQNTVAGLKFAESDATLADLGFKPGQSPGLPALGLTGVTDDVTWRGDFRQEIDYPVQMGQFKVVPYLMARYIPYSDSPDGGSQNRLLGGAGMRISTAFWKVDDTAKSNLFNVNRIRHVIEPELHVFTSCESVDQEDVFLYSEEVDRINAISAMQLALRQRWQTKRGGPGRWRSVDFFTLNAELNLFSNRPDDDLLQPVGFRGLFFDSIPEASIPRNSINADALWRMSDTLAVLGDCAYNLDEMALATTSLGVAVQRDPRLSYFAGVRYIGEINSTIASLALNYELSTKYSVQLLQSMSLSGEGNQNSSVTVIRRFDRFFATLSVFYDPVDDESGFRFAIVPQGLGSGLTSDRFSTVFGAQ